MQWKLFGKGGGGKRKERKGKNGYKIFDESSSIIK